MDSAKGHAVALEQIGHSFGGTVALDKIDLSISRGELIALLGPSGCGKTTMLQIIAGFLQPSSGAVTFDGKRVDRVPANRRRVGMVFQNYALFPHLTVFENVAYGLRARKSHAAEIRTKVMEMLARVQMSGFVDRMPRQLSGGQQQRIALARALAIEPGLVLLDEPFSALDKNLRLDMQIEIKSLLRNAGVTSVMVTHDQEEALSMADRVAVLNKGRIEQVDTPDALYDRPASLFVNGFIGHANLLRGAVVGGGRIRLEAGPEIRVPQQAEPARTGAVTVTVRPENVTLSDHADEARIPVTIRATMPLGAVSIVDCVTRAGEVLKVSQSRSAGAWHGHPGAAAWIGITDMNRVGVFRADAMPSSHSAEEI